MHQLVENNPQLNSELFLKSFPSIRRAVSAQSLTNPWNTYKVGITPEAMTRLEFCSEILETTNHEEVISGDEIDEIKNNISEVTEHIENSSIEHELKTFLLVQLENIRRGIFDYKIHGASGIRKAIEGVIGTTITQNDKYQNIKAKDNDVLVRLGALLNSIDSAMSKALKVKKMLGTLGKLLGISCMPDKKNGKKMGSGLVFCLPPMLA